MAWEVLSEILNSKKHRTNWSPIHEQIMLKYIDLSVELQKVPENGLRDFKSIAAVTAANSMTIVVRHYLKLCTAKVDSAEGEVSEALKVLSDVEDVDEYCDPEAALMAMVTEDDTEARTKKAMLMPWVKFLWEAFRTCLEVLRNNAKLEHLYQETAQRAFKFCLKFKRRNEFGRLCDQLRRHFGHIMKYQNQQNAIDLSNPESLQLHLETRFEQLNTAAKMDLWKNAFASIEDINNLMDMSKKAPKPQMLAMYYQKLAMILWKSEDYAFHATAWMKIFQISKEHKKTFATSDEAQLMASSVLLSTLCIPISNAGKGLMNDEPMFTQEKNARLCGLLGINIVPTREELLAQVISLNIVQYVPPQLKELYTMLEQQYHPLNLAKAVQPILDFIKTQKKMAHYTKPLQNITMIRLLKQMSQVYSSVSMSRLYKLIPFATPHEIEEFLVRAVTDRVISLRMNHRNHSITFGSALLMSSEEPDEGPQLQPLQSEMLRNMLTTLSKRLRTTADMMDPNKRIAANNARRQQIHAQIINKIEREHVANLGRKTIIETRKEFIEMQALMKTQQVHKQRHQLMAAHREKEKVRLEEEAKQRERDKAIKDQKEIERLNAMEKIEELRKTAIGARAFANIKPEDLENMDADEIMQKQVDQLEKEKREASTRLRALEKKHDYLERAKRAEELKIFAEMVKEQKKQWVEKSKKDHVVALDIKKRLQRMVPAQKSFIEEVLGERQNAYESERAAFEKKMEEQRIRKEKEAEEARKREEEARIEHERKMQEEEERRAIEAAERAVRLEKEREEAAEREAKLAEIEERKREREAEIEAREANREPEQRGYEDAPRERPRLNIQPRSGGSWRDREAARSDNAPPAHGGGDSGGGGGWRDREAARGGPPARGASGGWREREANRPGPPSRYGDDRGGRDERGGYGGRDSRENDGRDGGYGSRDSGGGGGWRDRRGAPTDDRGPRGPPRSGYGGPREGGGGWRSRDGAPPSGGDQRDRGPPRDRRAPRSDDDWSTVRK